MNVRVIVCMICAASFLAAGCGNNESEGVRTIGTNLQDPAQAGEERMGEPIFVGPIFPEMYPPSDNTADDPVDTERTPFEFVVLLRSTGEVPVDISEICLVGESDTARDQFILEAPETPVQSTSQVDQAVRITYDRQSPNGGGNVDRVSLVVQSNAENYPTYIVPFCGRVIGEGSDPQAIGCSTHLMVAPGESAEDLCNQ